MADEEFVILVLLLLEGTPDRVKRGLALGLLALFLLVDDIFLDLGRLFPQLLLSQDRDGERVKIDRSSLHLDSILRAELEGLDVGQLLAPYPGVYSWRRLAEFLAAAAPPPPPRASS